MRLPRTITGLALYAVLASGNPVAAAEPEGILGPREAHAPVTIDGIVWPTGFPNLVPTKAVHIQLGNAVKPSPLRLAETPVTLRKRGEPVTVNGIVYTTGFPNLVPTSTVDLATDSTFTTKAAAAPTTWSTISESGSTTATAPLRTEAVSVECVAKISGTEFTTACPTGSTTKTHPPVTIDGVVYPTGFPDLVPSTTVHLSTAVSTPVKDNTVAKKEASAAHGVRPPLAGFIRSALAAFR